MSMPPTSSIITYQAMTAVTCNCWPCQKTALGFTAGHKSCTSQLPRNYKHKITAPCYEIWYCIDISRFFRRSLVCKTLWNWMVRKYARIVDTGRIIVSYTGCILREGYQSIKKWSLRRWSDSPSTRATFLPSIAHGISSLLIWKRSTWQRFNI